MPTYFRAGTDKYPIAKIVIGEDISPKDKIHYTCAIATVEDEKVSLYGILGEDTCIGKESLTGKKALFQVFAKKKDIWDKDEKKFKTVDVSEEEEYLYQRIKGDIQDAKLEEFSIVIELSVHPLFFRELQKGAEKCNPEYCATLVENTCVVRSVVDASVKLTADDIKVLADFSGGTGKKTSSYAPKESEKEILDARFKFLVEHLDMKDEKITSCIELQALISGQKPEDQHLIGQTIALVLNLIGGRS